MKKFTKLPLLKLCSMIASIMLLYTQLNAQSCPKAVTWEQNFNSEQELDDNWFFYEGSNYPNNQEIAWFQRQNASIVKEGNSSYLKITAKYEPGLKAGRENLEFSSSRMHSRMPVTNDLKTVKYGKISARIKTSTNGDRAWPAFWMLPKNVNWPKDGEIDMMEQRVRKGKHVGLNGTTAYFQCPGGPCYLSKDTKSPEGANSFWNAFHVYGVEWSPNQLKYLLDGVVVYTINASDKPGLWPYNDKEFYVILNLAVGSQNTLYFKYNEVKDVNNPTPEEKIEQDRPTDPAYFNGKDVSMLVDWVKVEQGADDNEIVGDQQVYSGEVKDYYVARPGVDNAYTWNVPQGGKIESGQGTSAIKVKWIGGMTEPLRVNYANGNCRVALSRQVLSKGNPFPTVLAIENFEGAKPGFVPRSTGTRTFVPGNGGTVLNHTSAGGTMLYDFLGIRTSKIGNAHEFSMGYKKIVLDVWTNAPVGTKIAAQLENSITSQGSNFPTGVHSGYGASTTVKGRWETLELDAEALHNGTAPTSIDNIVILFDPGTASKYNYLIDNIRVRGINIPPAVKAGDMLEDYEVNFADKIKIENAISPGYNAGPRPNDYGVSATNGAKFVRPNGLYSGFFFATQVRLNGADFSSQNLKIQVSVKTNAPIGTTIQLNLQNNLLKQFNEFGGVNGVYVATTKTQNAYEVLTFVRNSDWFNRSSPESRITKDNEINQIGIYPYLGLDPKNKIVYTYFFDNLKVIAGSQANARIESVDESGDDFVVYPNPSNDFITVVIPGQAESKEIIMSDMTGKSVIQKNLDATKDEHIIDIKALNQGMYLIQMKSDNKVKVKKVIKL